MEAVTVPGFVEKLFAAIDEKKSYVVVGLDTRFEELPQVLLDEVSHRYSDRWEALEEALKLFNFRVIEAVMDQVVAVKLQLAFYEQYGWRGIRALQETARFARARGLLVIADAKRNDIGSSAEAYAKAYLGEPAFWEDGGADIYSSDAMTVNPYFGWDGIAPFLEQANKHGKGVFILVRTSNPSAAEIQDVAVLPPPDTAPQEAVSDREGAADPSAIGGRREAEPFPFWEYVARRVGIWQRELESPLYEGYGPLGVVVGATNPQAIAKVRQLLPESVLLLPGYGAQGATASDVVNAFDSRGLGALVNSSRGIIYAYKAGTWRGVYSEARFASAARAAARRMREAINRALKATGKSRF